MGQLKEADFLRWENTKRMTGLGKAEQDGMWEGILFHKASSLARARHFSFRMISLSYLDTTRDQQPYH